MNDQNSFTLGGIGALQPGWPDMPSAGAPGPWGGWQQPQGAGWGKTDPAPQMQGWQGASDAGWASPLPTPGGFGGQGQAGQPSGGPAWAPQMSAQIGQDKAAGMSRGPEAYAAMVPGQGGWGNQPSQSLQDIGSRAGFSPGASNAWAGLGLQAKGAGF